MPAIKHTIYFTCLSIYLLFISCDSKSRKPAKNDNVPIEWYNTFDTSKHIFTEINKSKYDTLHGWDFGWAIFDPINISSDDKNEINLCKRLSPGQKAFYFFWYLDDEVTNGGFIQYYWNGYGKYVPALIDGFKLINDSVMQKILIKSANEYLAHKEYFKTQKQKDDWEPLYNNLTKFDSFDELYLKNHDHSMEIFEKYIRQHPEEFVLLK